MKITGGVIMVGWLASALISGVLLSQCSPVTWHDNPRPLQSGVQPTGDPGLQQGRDLGSATVSDGLGSCFVEGVALATECLEHAPRCPYEDGDPSGWPCMWINPRTHLIYYVSSQEYWD